MILTAIPPSVAVLVAFGVFALFVLLAFALAYAKRDVHINITFLEVRR